MSLLISLGAGLNAQPGSSAGKIWFDLHLANASDSTSAVIAWPEAGDVLAEPANPPAVATILATLATSRAALSRAAAANPASPQPGQSGEDFIENLKTVLVEKGFGFADGFELPNPAATAKKLRIGINYTAFANRSTPADLPTTFELWVRTDLLPPDAPASSWSIRELATDPAVQALLRAQCGEAVVAIPAESIPENFSLVILPAQGQWRREVAVPKPHADQFIPIFAVAVATAGEAIQQKMLEKPRSAQNHTELAPPLHACFNQWPMAGEISFQDELSTVDGAYQQADHPAWVLRFTGFNPVRREIVTVGEIQLGATGRQPWAAFVEHQQAEGKSIDRLIAQKNSLESELTDWLTREIPWDSPHFATPADHARRVAALLKRPGVAAVETKVFRDQVAYTITWYPVLTTLEASGTYNSDRGGNISTKLTVQARDFGASLEGFIANRRRGLFADLSTTPKLTQLPDRAMSTWGLLGEYTRESPVRFGTPELFSIEDREDRAGLRWRLEGSHSTPPPALPHAGTTDATLSPATHARRWKLDVIAGYRRARLDAENFAFVNTPDGEAPFASTEFTGEWEHGSNPTQPKGAFHLELSADGSTSHAAVASFKRGQFKAVEEIRPEQDQGQNWLMRLTGSGGAASAGTPVAWWFRLGGDERMRGFELGELTGRSFLQAGFETGVGLGAFLTKPAAGAGQASPGFDFRQIRILLGIEHAWIGDPPSFLPATPVLRNASSYSVIGEYAGTIPGLPGNSKLAAGYGYAPESSHRHGRVFITLRVPLSIPPPR